MNYEYKSGARKIAGKSAQEVGEELERIELKRGSVTASAIVEESEPEDATLHEAFEWCDEKAAHEYRLAQARRIPRVLQVVTEEDKRQPAYVHVPNVVADADSAEGTYMPVVTVVDRPDLFHLAYTEAQRRLTSAQRSLNELAEAARESAEPEQMALIMMAIQAIETAGEAMRKLH